jgi:D,D-heptose 1,7-bisphosphate phosphatase
MKRPAVFFDRDNTLIVNDGYLGDPSKVQLVEGAAECVARVRSLGYAVVVFSNQSGVARGMFTEDDVHRVNARLDEALVDLLPHAVIDRHEFCPFHPEGTVPAYAKESDLRKPKPGMIFQAAEKLALDLSRSWVVGDAPRDIESGKAAGCKTIWFKDSKLPPSMAARELMLTVPDAVVSSLKEAADVIAREALVRHASPRETAPAAPPAPTPRSAPIEPPPAPPEPFRSEPEPAYAEVAMTEPEPPPAETRRAPGPRSVSSAKPLMQILAQKRAAARAEAASNSEENGASATATAPTVIAAASNARLEELAEQILQELQRRHHTSTGDFSITKLLAGIVQIVALAVLLIAFWMFQANLVPVLIVALFLQVFTVALLIMDRQK